VLATASGGSTINGIVAATQGWLMVLANTSGTDNLTLANQAAGSTAANRFLLPQGNNYVIPPQTFVQLIYSGGAWSPVS
jgi:hypothetical protein